MIAWFALSMAAAAEPVVVTAVTWKTRVEPQIPVEATLDPLPVDLTCHAIVTIEVDGRVREVEVQDCRGAYARATREALRGWRAAPVVWQGEAVRALTPVELRIVSPVGKAALADRGVGWSEVDWGRPDCVYTHPSRINVGVRTELLLSDVGRTGYEGRPCRMLAFVQEGQARSLVFDACEAKEREGAKAVRGEWRFDAGDGCTITPTMAQYRDLPQLSEIDAATSPIVNVHASELYVKQRADMVWPSEAVADKLIEAVCLVEVAIQTNGTVIRARPSSCPGPLKKAAVAAAMGWRWAPPAIDGLPIRAVTEIAVYTPGAVP